jgi:hypothetical protein
MQQRNQLHCHSHRFSSSQVHVPHHLQLSPFNTQPSPEDLQADMEFQLQRAVLQMHALSALNSVRTSSASALFHPQRTPTTGQPVPHLKPESGATSHSAVSEGDPELAPPAPAYSPATPFDVRQWLQVALAQGSSGGNGGGSGSSTPGSLLSLQVMAAMAAPQTASSGSEDAPTKGNLSAGSNTVLAMAAREALAQVRPIPLLKHVWLCEVSMYAAVI